MTAALACARGRYQRAIVLGRAALSGADLQGRAKKYGGRYRNSRENLFDRMTAAGVVWREVRGPHNRRILQLGTPGLTGSAVASVAKWVAVEIGVAP